MFFSLQPSQAILSDANEELINSYQAVRDEPHALLKELKKHQIKHGSDFYYWMRQRRFTNPIKKSSKVYLSQ